MPLYGYHCKECGRRFGQRLTYSEYGTVEIVCPKCQSVNVERLIGRVRFARSEESRLESLADPDSLAGLEDDPKALGRMMRQMSGEMGEELGPEFDEVVDRLESGQSPEEIESSMPDLADDLPGGGGPFD